MESFLNEFEKKETFVACPFCLESKQFTSNQYLNNHIKYKHPRKDTKEIEKNVSKPTLLVLHPKPKASLSDNIPHNRSRVPAKTFKRPGGSSKRQSYTLKFKLKVLQDLDEAVRDKEVKDKYKSVAEKYGISKSMVCKWLKQKQELKQEADKLRAKKTRYGRDSAATSRTRKRLRNYRLKKYPLAVQRVVSEFRKRRSEGIKVSGRWLKMKQTLRTFYEDEVAETFKAEKQIRKRFGIVKGFQVFKPFIVN